MSRTTCECGHGADDHSSHFAFVPSKHLGCVKCDCREEVAFVLNGVVVFTDFRTRLFANPNAAPKADPR